MNRKNYHISIKAVIVKKDKVLVFKKIKNNMEVYDFPGGRIDEGETIEKGLTREFKEELGIENFKIGDLVNAFEWFYYGKKEASLMLLCFKVEADISNIKLSKEHTDLDWISRENLGKIPKTKINEGLIQTIEKVLN